MLTSNRNKPIFHEWLMLIDTKCMRQMCKIINHLRINTQVVMCRHDKPNVFKLLTTYKYKDRDVFIPEGPIMRLSNKLKDTNNFDSYIK